MAKKHLDAVGLYLKEIARYELLTVEEELCYAKLVQEHRYIEKQRQILSLKFDTNDVENQLATLLNKDKKTFKIIEDRAKIAARKMCEANLRLVVAIAKKYQGRGLDLLDLIQEGAVGLCSAIQKFDPKKGYKLSTYSYWWIKQGVTRAISQQGRTIRLPVYLIEAINTIKKCSRELSHSLGRNPTLQELSDATRIESSKIEGYLKASNKVRSLDIKFGENNDLSLIECIPSNELNNYELIDQELLKDDLNSILSNMLDDTKNVLIMRYGIENGNELTLSEVGKQLGYSRERVRHIQIQGTSILRKRYKNTDIKYLLGD